MVVHALDLIMEIHSSQDAFVTVMDFLTFCSDELLATNCVVKPVKLVGIKLSHQFVQLFASPSSVVVEINSRNSQEKFIDDLFGDIYSCFF